MYGEPALPPDFVSLPHVNPDAPKGGEVVFGEPGGYDSMNPFILKGRPATGISTLVIETLLGRSYDEPFTLYGLLAGSLRTDEARTYVEFTLRDEARFSDGSPVTVEDVIWSFEVLGTLGNPRYHAAWKKISQAEKTGPKSVRFTFTAPDREMPLILGLRPILQKAQWQGKAFDASTLEVPIGSGPYKVESFTPGQTVLYKRDPNWWGKDLPFNRGQHNFDQIRYDYFNDSTVIFEAFKAGLLSSWREGNPAKWEQIYIWPDVKSGAVVKSEIPHQRPSGIEGFAMNTRRDLFKDWRVREALILAFHFDLVNQTLNAGKYPRIASYFGNSPLGMVPGTAAEGKVAELLQPFAATLMPGVREGYALPQTDARPGNRPNLRKAMTLLQEAGFSVDDKGQMRDPSGKPFQFEILLTNGQSAMIAAADIYVQALSTLGITAKVTTVDDAQYRARTNEYDFDMTHFVRSLSLSPGTEQALYWGSNGAQVSGTRNWPGIDSAAADAMMAQMVNAKDPETFTAATQALDRILTAGRYVVPIWYSDRSRIAHRKELNFPDKIPLYGDWLGFQPETWWYQD